MPTQPERKIVVTVPPNLDEVIEAVEADEDAGFCLACGSIAYGLEPDARECECEECGEAAVYGASEILVMGIAR